MVTFILSKPHKRVLYYLNFDKSLDFKIDNYYNCFMYNKEEQSTIDIQPTQEIADESMDNMPNPDEVNEIISASAPEDNNTVKVGENKSSKKKNARILTRKLTLTAVLTGLAFGLYMLGPLCKLPFMFPVFFDLQFSELPALIGGFALGPAYGCLIIILKCVLKLPLSQTACVGELCDCILGIVFVLTSSLIYYFHKNKKGAIWAILAGAFAIVVASVALNYFVNIPFYIQFYFKGEWEPLLGMLSVLFPNITKDNFYAYYLCLSVIPFNILRALITSFVTFAVYKKVSILFKKFTG